MAPRPGYRARVRPTAQVRSHTLELVADNDAATTEVDWRPGCAGEIASPHDVLRLARALQQCQQGNTAVQDVFLSHNPTLTDAVARPLAAALRGSGVCSVRLEGTAVSTSRCRPSCSTPKSRRRWPPGCRPSASGAVAATVAVEQAEQQEAGRSGRGGGCS